MQRLGSRNEVLKVFNRWEEIGLLSNHLIFRAVRKEEWQQDVGCSVHQLKCVVLRDEDLKDFELVRQFGQDRLIGLLGALHELLVFCWRSSR